jgi:hypothetical protein
MRRQYYVIILIWFIGGLLSYFLANLPIRQYVLDGHILPYGADSFYHAVRILHLLNTGDLLQFDTRLNAPYGDMVCWPWGYDTFMASLVWFFNKIYVGYAPEYILINIPPFLVWVNLALIIGITRAVRLPMKYTVLTVVCFVLSPLTQELHLLGRIDHHMIEYTFVLGTLLAGIYWFKDTDNKLMAINLGLILGLSTVFHNGLFILQIPLVITTLILWLLNSRGPVHTGTLALSLTVTTVLTLLPSQAFQEGYFSYIYYSWFHLYIASATSITLIFLSRTSVCNKSLVQLLILSVVLVLPVLSEIFSGVRFIGADISLYENIDEMASPLSFVNGTMNDFFITIRKYSALFLLLPVGMASLGIWALSDRSPFKIFFLISSLMGLILMLSLARLNYYGSYTLYIPLFIGAMMLSEYQSRYKHLVTAFATALVIIAHTPSVWSLFESRPLGGYFDYALTKQIYPEFAESCSEDPGIVLADFNDGHYILFHTQCSVIADNMNMSEMDFERVNETERLFSLSAEEIIEQETLVDYIFVRREDNIYHDLTEDEILSANKGLRAELLFREDLPTGLSLLSEVYYEKNNKLQAILAKLYKINR